MITGSPAKWADKMREISIRRMTRPGDGHRVAGLRLPPEVTGLNRREREIATIVYALHAATAEHVCANLTDELHNASVRSMLNRLVAKKILNRILSGRAFVYLPAISWTDSGSSALRRFIDDYFEGSSARAAESVRRLLGAN